MVIITEMRTTVETLTVTGYGVNARDVLYDVSLYTKKCVSSRRAAPYPTLPHKLREPSAPTKPSS